MKRLLVLTILIVFILVWVGRGACSEMISAYTDKLNMKSDATTVFFSHSPKTYKLEDLQNYFGKISPNETLIYGMSKDLSHLSMKSINEKFPIECIRENGPVCSYSVYRVEEGGCFYVFWSKHLANGTFASEVDRITALCTVYISNLANFNDFSSLVIGINTADDVSRICSAFEITDVMSTGIHSFSLLDDGTVLDILYENNGPIASRQDLIIKQINVISNEYAQTVSYLACIDYNDLP